MLRWFLFESRAGDVPLARLERVGGLAVVDVGKVEPSAMRIIAAQKRASSANA